MQLFELYATLGIKIEEFEAGVNQAREKFTAFAQAAQGDMDAVTSALGRNVPVEGVEAAIAKLTELRGLVGQVNKGDGGAEVQEKSAGGLGDLIFSGIGKAISGIEGVRDIVDGASGVVERCIELRDTVAALLEWPIVPKEQPSQTGDSGNASASDTGASALNGVASAAESAAAGLRTAGTAALTGAAGIRALSASTAGALGGLNSLRAGLSNAASAASAFASKVNSLEIKVPTFTQGGSVPMAKGGVFKKPTLFPSNHLVGEAGAEGVLPLKTLWEELGTRIDAAFASYSGIDYERMAEANAERPVYLNVGKDRLAKSVATENARAIAGRNRQIAFGYGER